VTVPRAIDDPSKHAAATFNMTPMIDVVFQLIVVFLCSMKFRTLDQKIEAHMPTEKGVRDRAIPDPPEVRTVLRLRLQRAGPGAPTLVVLQGERLGTADEGDRVWERLRASVAAVRARSPDLEARIDAAPDVEHGDVVKALDGLVAAGQERIEFTGVRPPPRK
jgi:biopolymer transport protein ExbD